MKVYVKKYKLKNWVKELLMVGLFILIILGVLEIYSNKIEKIESGEIELIYQYGGDIWLEYKKEKNSTAK